MKQVNLLISGITSALLVTTMLFSCKKENTTSVSNSITWTINGSSFDGSSSSFAQRLGSAPTIVIQGKSSDCILSFNLMNADTTGSYIAKLLTTEPNSAFVNVMRNNIEYDAVYCLAGEKVVIRVTSLSAESIKATFEGVVRSAASDVLNLSGSFQLKIRP